MEPRISVVTLGVRDLERARRFYEAMGLRQADSPPGVVFYPMGGLILSLYPWDELAEDATVAAPGEGFRGIALAYNVRERDEVAQVLADAERAGGRVVKPAQDAFWGGHSGYFADPDGHLWEVAYNPHWPIAEDGRIHLPARG